MKKIIVIALAVVMALSLVLVLAACGGETYEGECHYANKWDSTKPDYGVKVKVTVKGDVITAVKIVDYPEWTRTTSSWTASEGKNPGDVGYQLGYAAAEAAYAAWIEKTFVGKTVAEVNAYQATATVDGQSVDTASAKLVGATQSAARIIVAVQNALSKIPAAE